MTPVPSIVDNSVVSALPETSSRDQLKKKKHKKEKSKKHHRKDKSSRLSEGESTHNFTGNEDYYIDKDPAIGYRNVDTLHRPACPRYKVRLPHLGITRPWKTVAYKRYYEKDKHNRISNSKVTLSDEEFTMKTKAFKERLARSPHDLSIWLEYVQHQHVFPMSTTKAQLCERKLDVLRQGLQANPGNEKLYREYVRIVDETYPSYEVSKILDALITKGLSCDTASRYSSKICVFYCRSDQLYSVECIDIGHTGLNGPMQCAGCAKTLCPLHAKFI